MRAIVTGSIAFDYIMSMPGRFRDHILPEKLHVLNVSFLMDKLRQEKGGVGGNQAYGLSLLGIKTSLLAAVGNDFAEYREHLLKAGVDVSGVRVYKKLPTAFGFVMSDKEDNQIWAFYPGAMVKASCLSLGKYYKKEKPFVVIAPNDTQAMVNYIRECKLGGLDYLFDPAFYIPSLSAKNLRSGVMGAKIVIGNDYENTMLLRKTGLSKGQILSRDRILITTLGKRGSLVESKNNKIRVAVAKPKNTSDPTGAGDAYRSGFLAGYLRGFSLDICGKMGAVAACYTVEKFGTQTHSFTIKGFEQRYKQNFKQDLRL